MATAGLAGLGAATAAYANQVELKRFTLRHVVVPVRATALPSGDLRILHISDIHYVPGQKKKYRWLQSLAELEPDLVVNTGDNLSHQEAVPEVLDALGPVMKYPGVFVAGSNDYYAPRVKNPLQYLWGPSEIDPEGDRLPTEELFGAFEAAGWQNLSNAYAAMTTSGTAVELSGVDDPHIGLDRIPGWPGGPTGDEMGPLRIAAAHAPVDRVLRGYADARADLILAGHTHGGQVCLPSFPTGEGRALVTNCDLPPEQAKGLHRVSSSDGSGVSFHVSAGIGTSATAPVRLFCPPEATLLTLTEESPALQE